MSGAPKPPRTKQAAWLIAVTAIAFTAGLLGFAYWFTRPQSAAAVKKGLAFVALGKSVYDRTCASCHGANLDGQPDWQRRLPNGRLPAPPHDDSGHTWHHADEVLLGITRYGMVPPYAPAGYPSDMPAFKDMLSDEEIRAVLAFLESRWSPKVLQWRREAGMEAK